MEHITKIAKDLRNGMYSRVAAAKYNHSLSTIKDIRSEHIGVTSKIARQLNSDSEFKEYFIKLYSNISLKIKDIVPIIQKHPIFKRRSVNYQRIGELRKFYELPPRMSENIYKDNNDRIKGYIIRNSKFMAKRRNIEFDLTYHDFEAPKYCPILNVKLLYRSEGNPQNPYHASLDRIDNKKGYIKGNVIVMSRLANAMKNSASFSELKSFSTNILKLVNHVENQGALGSITDIFDNYIPRT